MKKTILKFFAHIIMVIAWRFPSDHDYKNINRLKMLIILILAVSSVIDARDLDKVRLIVRADDIGVARSVNEAVIDSHLKGIVTTVELMMPTPWFPDAVRLLEKNPQINVGLHLTLTSEWERMKWRPLTNATSITCDDGYFLPMIWPNPNFGPHEVLSNIDWCLKEIEAEFRAQIEMGLRHVPRATHITGHMGCGHWHEDVMELWDRLADEYGLRIYPGELGVGRMPGWGRERDLEKRVEIFIRNLRNLEPGTWLFVEHPAYDTPEIRALGHIGYEDVAADREGVTRVFTDRRVIEAIRELGIELISYSDLVRP